MFHSICDIFHSSSKSFLLYNCRLYYSAVVVSQLDMTSIHQRLHSLPYLRYPRDRLHILCSGTCILKIQAERSSWLDKGSTGMNRYSPVCMYFQDTADKWIPVIRILVNMGIGIMKCMPGAHLHCGHSCLLYYSCMMTGHWYCRLHHRV